MLPEDNYANESFLLKDFLDVDSAKEEAAHITTISGRERMFTTFHCPLDNCHSRTILKKSLRVC